MTKINNFLKCISRVYLENFMDPGGGQNLERPIFRNFEITNIKISKDELFDSFISEFIFYYS